jgi:hypothetical protein
MRGVRDHRGLPPATHSHPRRGHGLTLSKHGRNRPALAITGRTGSLPSWDETLTCVGSGCHPIDDNVGEQWQRTEMVFPEPPEHPPPFPEPPEPPPVPPFPEPPEPPPVPPFPEPPEPPPVPPFPEPPEPPPVPPFPEPPEPPPVPPLGTPAGDACGGRTPLGELRS